jgi:hypothetical protein
MLVHKKADLLQFLNKLKVRVILTHLVAISFFLIAARQIGALFLFIILYGPQPAWLVQLLNKPTGATLVSYSIIIEFYLILLIAFTLSVILNVRHNTFWLNSVIAAIGSFISLFIYNIVALRHLFWIFGKLFIKYGNTYYALANIIFYLALGLFIFYSKWTKQFAYGGGDSPPTPLQPKVERGANVE